MLALTPTGAQGVVCQDANGRGGAGAEADGNASNTACGTAAKANGSYGYNTATGTRANASGGWSTNTAYGDTANASGDSSYNTAIGGNADASGNNSINTATGYNTNASGDYSHNIAIGSQANASASGSSGNEVSNIAIGTSAQATGANAMAFGADTSATHANAAAFGNGATTSRANQQVFGTGSNTYTMTGIDSQASRDAQGQTKKIVTTDSNGNLAAFTADELGLGGTDLSAVNARLAGIDSRLNNIAGRADKAITGVAMAFAMAGVPTLLPTETVALALNAGTYDGSQGYALNAAVRINNNMQFNGGVGYGPDQNIVGGRAGLRIGW